jgi:hypothetical protein
MHTWSQDELRRVGETDDFHIAPYREDGRTPGTPTWTWSVVVDGDVYVRAYNGTASRWHRAAMSQRAGRVHLGGQDREVGFEPVDGDVQDRIDDAYRTKYAHSAYLAPMISDRARAATVRVLPR